MTDKDGDGDIQVLEENWLDDEEEEEEEDVKWQS